MIKSSLDWQFLEHGLLTKSYMIDDWSNRIQCRKMIDNIGFKIADLSRAEVVARRCRSNLANKLIEEINNDIRLVEEYILMATLIG